MNIKWNWGTGITIAIVLCVTGFLAFVYNVSQHDVDLVSPDYYPKGIDYQKRIESTKNAARLGETIKVQQTGDSVIIRYPSVWKGKTITGSIVFYRPSDTKSDITIAPAPDTLGTQRLVMTALKNGKYHVQCDIVCDNVSYYFDYPLVVNK